MKFRKVLKARIERRIIRFKVQSKHSTSTVWKFRQAQNSYVIDSLMSQTRRVSKPRGKRNIVFVSW